MMKPEFLVMTKTKAQLSQWKLPETPRPKTRYDTSLHNSPFLSVDVLPLENSGGFLRYGLVRIFIFAHAACVLNYLTESFVPSTHVVVVEFHRCP